MLPPTNALDLILKRLAALEYEVAVMRDELDEKRADMGAASDPDCWIGGNDGPDD